MEKTEQNSRWGRPRLIGLSILAAVAIVIAGFALLRLGSYAKPAAPRDQANARPLPRAVPLPPADVQQHSVSASAAASESKPKMLSGKPDERPAGIEASLGLVPTSEPGRAVAEPLAPQSSPEKTAPTTAALPMTESEIMAYLRRPPSFAPDNSGEYHQRNELMNTLREQAQDKQAVTALLLDIYRDESQGELLQSYAIQHLSFWAQTGKIEAADRERAMAALREAAADYATTYIGGAGLLALHDAAGAEAAQPALEALASPAASVNSRISAFQVCAQLGEQRALSTAERTARDESASFVLRMSAVSALAALGGRGSEASLRTLAQDRNKQVRRAAELALARINR